MIAGINIRMVGITIYKRANKPSINHLLIYSFLRSHVGVFFRLGGCGCDCRTRLWPRGPDNSERPRFGWIPQQLWRHVSPSQLWNDAAARSGMHGFQHIPPVKVRLRLGFVRKWGTPWIHEIQWFIIIFLHQDCCFGECLSGQHHLTTVQHSFLHLKTR